jgi:catechol 2,3-dioxygenase-like lactoylglutathione lyase family enzyme
MAIVLDHTIVPAKDKVTSAQFFAEIFGLTIKLGQSDFAQVKVNESLTFDFANNTRFNRTAQRHHYAFYVSEAEFETIFGRVKAKGLLYGSGPYSHADRQIYTRQRGRGFYFEDPNGHLLEVMTVCPRQGAKVWRSE